MTNDELRELHRAAKSLLHCREELQRYQTEEHLHDEALKPWISIEIGNHPTYLAALKVSIYKPEHRAALHKMVVAELKSNIKSLEAKFRHLKGK